MKECNSCGKEAKVQLFKHEIHPVIKIAGFDYPHNFSICKDCIMEEIEDALDKLEENEEIDILIENQRFSERFVNEDLQEMEE